MAGSDLTYLRKKPELFAAPAKNGVARIVEGPVFMQQPALLTGSKKGWRSEDRYAALRSSS